MKAILFALLLIAPSALADSRLVCVLEQPIAAATTNGWGGTQVLADATFYKDCNGIVHIEGVLWKFTGYPSHVTQTVAYDEIAFVLPVGYRPANGQWFSSVSATGGARVSVLPSGEVVVTTSFNYFGWVSLAGMTFRAQ
jgi:hypothetical protein